MLMSAIMPLVFLLIGCDAILTATFLIFDVFVSATKDDDQEA